MPLPSLPSNTENCTHLGKGGYFGVLCNILLLTNSFVCIFKYEPGNKALTNTIFVDLELLNLSKSGVDFISIMRI